MFVALNFKSPIAKKRKSYTYRRNNNNTQILPPFLILLPPYLLTQFSLKRCKNSKIISIIIDFQ